MKFKVFVVLSILILAVLLLVSCSDIPVPTEPAPQSYEEITNTPDELLIGWFNLYIVYSSEGTSRYHILALAYQNELNKREIMRGQK